MKKSARWGLLLAAVAGLGVALVGVFALSLSTSGRLDVSNFIWLFWANVAVATLLLAVLALAAMRLLRRLLIGKFGSRLLLKLAGIFALVGVLPGLLIYGLSTQFVTRSIDSGFGLEVDRALEAGLALGGGMLDAAAADLARKTAQAAQRLPAGSGGGGDGWQPAPFSQATLDTLRQQLGARDLLLLDGQGEVLARASTRAGQSTPLPERPVIALIGQARRAGMAYALEGLDDELPAAAARRPALARAVVPLGPPGATSSAASSAANGTDLSAAGRARARYLMAVQPLPPMLVAHALQLQSANRDYQQRRLARDGLQRMYLGTLTLALVLSVLAAVLLAVMLGNQIVRPLLLLADGMRQVAAGDLTTKPVFGSRDELGGLTRSFALMTEQLSDAREQVQRGVSQLEGARTRLQTILDSLSAGVIVFDRDGRIDTVNPGATRILRQPLGAYRGRPLGEVPGLADFAAMVWQRGELHRSSPEAGERDHWQDAYELQRADPVQSRGAAPSTEPGDTPLPPGHPATSSQQESLNLLLRGANLPGGARLLVFDDITEVVSAQRGVAWAEVARRLAHEIKNPLTPIQLSAERLAHKLGPRLDDASRTLLERAVATIVTQVQAMKQLVDEFRDYARLPAAQLAPLDLNALVQQVLGLYGAAQEQGRVQTRLEPDLPWIEGDATQLRQVVHNLLQNALDAVQERADGCVQLVTEAARDEHGALRTVRLKVIDNGPGFAEKVLRRAFEPYVTTKSKGTGLGLAVVRKIADEHGARVRAANRLAEAGGAVPEGWVLGAQVSLSFSRFARAHPPSP